MGTASSSLQCLHKVGGHGAVLGPGIGDVHGTGSPVPTTLAQAVLTPSVITSQGGIFWFTLIDTYSTGFGLCIVALFMCLGIAFCYGEGRGCCSPGHCRGVLTAQGSP